jgi:two-component system KDP operon response regulator KdpE
MTQPVVILIEDDPQIRRFVRSALEEEGWQVHEADTCKRGLAEAGTRKPNLVIVDLGLPDGDGIIVIQDIRGWSNVPIIVLSARTNEDEKITVLDAGADDYLAKPFGLGELMARVRANLRRPRVVSTDARHNPTTHTDMIFRFGTIEVNRIERIVRRQGTEVHLTPIEYRLLTVLMTHVGRVITHRQLLREVWGPSHAEQNHYLRIYMGHLRQKLEIDPAQPQYLLTETGVGYRLLPDV